ncbi:TonB-dependent receptor [Pedobacter sp. L105]|uniref:TonB-dependent receptor n=1 Tax=Pedobacter sp. L105 TaxID=1641871 RepID=UPI00131C9F20|nr:TonB-dependent receptor [Pedobacter sp. L105]
MKLPLLSIVFLLLLSIAARSQNVYTVKGSVVDTVSNLRLKNTAVSVLRSKDSTLVRFTRVNESGTFAISNLPKGKFFLLVTYPGYADYVEPFRLDSTKTNADVGTLKMTLKATLLANVIIKAKAAAVKIKGDTTEFNASAFVVQPNAKVEDLLKQMPGIQVDKDGKITAQGKTVSKVLLDGEEFFGDDPTLVTKNIRADMVDKVQLYDKNSDQAAFTGIDDDKKTKTINIKLKDSKKSGYFGKLDAGGATGSYYQTQDMFNIFKDKQKFSVYGTIANNGKTGLGWEDGSKYGGGSDNVTTTDDGGIMISGSSDGSGLDSWDGRYNNQGLPVARTGGVHYDTKWNSDKESLNANYKVGYLKVEGDRNTLTQNNLSTGIINTNSDEKFDNDILRQKMDGSYQLKIDTSSNLKVSFDGTLRNTNSNSDFTAGSLRNNAIPLTNSIRSVTNDDHGKIFNAKALWTKKFKKPRRTISLDLSESATNSDSKGYVKSNIDYFNGTGVKDSSQTINQYKTSLKKISDFKSNLAYTEPLSKTLSVILNYGLEINNSSTNTESFNQGLGGAYTQLDSLYSTNYQFDQTANQGGAFMNFKDNKSTFNFGTKVTDVSFDQTNLYNNTNFKRNFVNWNPKLNYKYKLAKQSSISVEYDGTTIQPQISQIQPLLNNTDPLNITLGNPDLRPSFKHSVGLEYSSYKILSSRNLYFYGNYNVTTNPIVSNTVTDSAGKSTFQSVNLTTKKASGLYLYASAGQKIPGIDINAGFQFSVNSNTSYNYANGVLNKNQAATYNGGISFSKWLEKKYEFYAQGGPTYTTNESSIQQGINDNGWGIKANGGMAFYLPLKFEIRSDADYEYRGKTQSFNTTFNRVIWNASVSKKFTKSEGLKFTLSANDLLNQNVGFSRTASANLITQNTYTTIRRYFMASISWDFSKMGITPSKK